MLTVAQAAKRLGISPALIYELCRHGLIRHFRHGRPGRRGVIRIAEAALEEYQVSCESDGRLAEGHLKHLH